MFLKLLAEGKLFAADKKLKKLSDVFYKIIKVIRDETPGSLNYLRNGNIKIVNQDNKLIAEVPVSEFVSAAKTLFKEIAGAEETTFDSAKTRKFMKRIFCKSIKAESKDKSDIKVVVYDQVVARSTELGFSIKSDLGAAPTLLNSGKTTNFVFEIEGKINPVDIESLNQKGVQEIVKELLRKQCKLTYKDIESQVFKANLQVLDSKMPELVSDMLVLYYSGKTSKIAEMLTDINGRNPLGFVSAGEHKYYEYKVKNLLTDIALGMTPGTVWQGRYDATGGYIIVKEDGELLCFHIYNRNDFQDYLLENTKLDTPSTTKYKFGEIYRDNGKFYIKLNLQIRFID